MAKHSKKKTIALLDRAFRRGWQPGRGHVSDYAKKRSTPKTREDQ